MYEYSTRAIGYKCDNVFFFKKGDRVSRAYFSLFRYSSLGHSDKLFEIPLYDRDDEILIDYKAWPR
ncbi:MAG: hypothetical protein RLZZ262_2246 [Bacteroidota bacterium]|jgi:hypothetical protein